METLKSAYSDEYINRLGQSIVKIYKDFPTNAFHKDVFDAAWMDKTLKERMSHIRACLHKHLNLPFEQATSVLLQIMTTGQTLELLFVPDYIQTYGINKWGISMRAFEGSTAFASAEFGVRPFIEKYPEKTFEQLLKWTEHSSEHIRRLASECCRPRLPWSNQLNQLIEDPSPIIPILNKLFNDPSEYVRRSVSNNLNDICKDHPNLAIQLAEKWIKSGELGYKTAKHGIRTLLKKGNQRALELFGLGANPAIIQKNLSISKTPITQAEQLCFHFDIINSSKVAIACRLEYRVYYMKKNGNLQAKIFKISQKQVPPGIHKMERKHAFKDLSTRKHYPGEHAIEIIINGIAFEKLSFELM